MSDWCGSTPLTPGSQDVLATSHNNIGTLHRDTGYPDQALESYGRELAVREQLAREHPEVADYASELGATFNNLAMFALARKGYGEARAKLDQALMWQKKAQAAYPKHPTYRYRMTQQLTNMIQAAKGLKDLKATDEAQRALDELIASDPRFATLDTRLAAVLNGTAPKDNTERLELAWRAQSTGRYSAAARLWAEALEADPKLADSRQAQHRYNAACAAALAGSGRGKDDPAPDEAAQPGSEVRLGPGSRPS